MIGWGKRLVIIHAGSETGFISNALLTFWSDSKMEDYHDSMNAECVEQWFSALLPKVPPISLIAMDNASYHSSQLNKPRTTNTKKGDVAEREQHRLQRRNAECGAPSASEAAAPAASICRRRNGQTDVMRC